MATKACQVSIDSAYLVLKTQRKKMRRFKKNKKLFNREHGAAFERHPNHIAHAREYTLRSACGISAFRQTRGNSLRQIAKTTPILSSCFQNRSHNLTQMLNITSVKVTKRKSRKKTPFCTDSSTLTGSAWWSVAVVLLPAKPPSLR